MFIVASRKSINLEITERFLYAGQKFLTGVFDTEFGQSIVIESSDQASAEYLVGRLGSGLYGARDFDTLSEALAYLKEDLGIS